VNVSVPYGQWKAVNPPGSFSWFDYAHCVLREGQISGDLAVALAQLIWPQFVKIDGLIFLAEQYSEEKASSLRGQGIIGRELEYWMNLFSVDGFFADISGSTQEQEEGFAETLVQAWRAKLFSDFGSHAFTVEIVRDDDVGDLCVVFMQGVVDGT
jgi:hypothetical protein